jgi:hypothetical protein
MQQWGKTTHDSSTVQYLGSFCFQHICYWHPGPVSTLSLFANRYRYNVSVKMSTEQNRQLCFPTFWSANGILNNILIMLMVRTGVGPKGVPLHSHPPPTVYSLCTSLEPGLATSLSRLLSRNVARIGRICTVRLLWRLSSLGGLNELSKRICWSASAHLKESVLSAISETFSIAPAAPTVWPANQSHINNSLS